MMKTSNFAERGLALLGSLALTVALLAFSFAAPQAGSIAGVLA